MTKEELNKQLLDVCLADTVDYARAEELLRQGAEPLGRIEHWGTPPHLENLYGAILTDFGYRTDYPEDLYRITELFLHYGMDIGKPSVPYTGKDWNPLMDFAYPSFSPESTRPDESSANVLRALMLLLEHGLRAEDAFVCWNELLCDFSLVLNPSDPYDRRIMNDHLQKLMLIASYPHILDADADLREAIWLEKNHYDLTRLRNWQDYFFEIDSSRCKELFGSSRVIVTIFEKSSGQKAWVFGVDLKPEEL